MQFEKTPRVPRVLVLGPYASATVRTVPEAFCFRAVRACVRCDHVHVNIISHKPLVRFHEICSCVEFVDKDELIRF